MTMWLVALECDQLLKHAESGRIRLHRPAVRILSVQVRSPVNLRVCCIFCIFIYVDAVVLGVVVVDVFMRRFSNPVQARRISVNLPAVSVHETERVCPMY